MIIIGHENATSVTTPEESLSAWEKFFSRLQRNSAISPTQ